MESKASQFSARRLRKIGGLLSVVFLVLLIVRSIAAQELTSQRIEAADKEPQNWSTFFGNYKGWSYSPLTQITRENIKHLVPAWAFPTGGQNGLEAAPLVVDGVLYIENHQNQVFAVDAATGRPLWTYAYVNSDRAATQGVVAARGLAVGYGMVFMGTRNNHMVAIDAKTGEEVWNVQVPDAIPCCGMTGAPLLVKNQVIAGVTGGEVAHRGYLTSFDAKTGKVLWRFYTIPAPGEPNSETWPGDSWKTGGGATWFTGSYDPELNLIYWGVGNPSSDFFGEHRQGSNLYTDSVIALDADTGKMKWYFQEIPHDLYDFDANAEVVLFDARQNGQTRKLLIHSNKGGYAYVLDRVTGQLVKAFPYAQTVNWSGGLDKNGKPIKPVIPAKGSDYLFCPGGLGGRNYNHSAYSPRTGLWYSNDFELCSRISPVDMEVNEGAGLFGGTMAFQLNPDAKPNISAFDPLTGERRWTFPTVFVNASSLLATASDLIFAGDLQGYAFALDAKTGEKLWSFNTGGRIAAPPVSYSVNGRQYVAISTGGGAIAERYVANLFPEAKGHLPASTSTLFVFALPSGGE